MPDFEIPEVAVGVGARAIREHPGLVYARADVVLPQVSAAVLTAALPHLYRAWLEGLIAKAVDQYRNGSGAMAWRAADAAVWLRAELEERQ